MRDYLEELKERTGAVLLRQLLALERAMAGLNRGEEAGEERAGPDPARRRAESGPRAGRVERAPGLEEGTGRGREPWMAAAGAPDLPVRPAAPDAAGPEETGQRWPALEQLERLARAGAAPYARSLAWPSQGEAERREFPGRAAGPRPARGWAGRAGQELDAPEEGGLQPARGWQAPGGERGDWIEQADRAFRRDSRRYDGGFYLY